MSNTKIIIGSILILLSIPLTFITPIFNIFVFLLGLYFIIYNKDENQVEKRKDIKNKKA